MGWGLEWGLVPGLEKKVVEICRNKTGKIENGVIYHLTTLKNMNQI